MKKILALAYGMLAYLLFLVAFLYAVGFAANLVVPKGIDSGPPVPFAQALLINIALLGLFGLQHSVMARPGFKKWWTKIVPAPVERSTFVLITSVLLLFIFWQWRPMPGVVWEVESGLGEMLFWALFWAGWAVVLASSFVIDHFDLFGVRQVVLYSQGKAYTHLEFKASAFYKYVRHPLLLGFLVAFWATPRMTVGHLVFALVITGYVLVAVRLEERDLVRFHGKAYEDYQRRVPMLLPGYRRKEAFAPLKPSVTEPEGRAG